MALLLSCVLLCGSCSWPYYWDFMGTVSLSHGEDPVPPGSYNLSIPSFIWSLNLRCRDFAIDVSLGVGHSTVRFTFMSSYELDAGKSVYVISLSQWRMWVPKSLSTGATHQITFISHSSKDRQVQAQGAGRQSVRQGPFVSQTALPWWVFTWQRAEQVLSGLSGKTLGLFVRVPELWIQYCSLKVQPPDTVALISRFHYLTSGRNKHPNPSSDHCMHVSFECLLLWVHTKVGR